VYLRVLRVQFVQGDSKAAMHMKAQHVLEVGSDSRVPVHTYARGGARDFCVSHTCCFYRCTGTFGTLYRLRSDKMINCTEFGRMRNQAVLAFSVYRLSSIFLERLRKTGRICQDSRSSGRGTNFVFLEYKVVVPTTTSQRSAPRCNM
jgi:hypothetical protein